jgi:hypothetical protein
LRAFNKESAIMPKATFETLDGDDIEIDPADVVRLAAGEEEETALIELDDGDEIIVVATPREVAAALGINPREYIEEEEEDEDEPIDEEDGYDE